MVGLIAVVAGFALGESAGRESVQAELDDAWSQNYDLWQQLDEKDREIEALRERLSGFGDAGSPDAGPLDPYSFEPWPGLTGQMLTEGFPGDGVYLVGLDIEAGTYQTSGAYGCIWTRLPGDGMAGEITDFSDGPGEVTIEESDLAFITTGCADWTRVR